MVLLTYNIPENIKVIAKQGESDEFDLNLFFSSEGTGSTARFKYVEYVQKWLDLIRGSYLETTVDELKLGATKPPMPYSDIRLLNVLTHTLWFMPNVASCHAMANLLKEKQNSFFHDYKINVCAGTGAGIGFSALGPVQESMRDPLHSKTNTLCFHAASLLQGSLYVPGPEYSCFATSLAQKRTSMQPSGSRVPGPLRRTMEMEKK